MRWVSWGKPVFELTASSQLVVQMDEEAGEMVVVLVCNRCPQWEILPVH